ATQAFNPKSIEPTPFDDFVRCQRMHRGQPAPVGPWSGRQSLVLSTNQAPEPQAVFIVNRKREPTIWCESTADLFKEQQGCVSPFDDGMRENQVELARQPSERLLREIVDRLEHWHTPRWR